MLIHQEDKPHGFWKLAKIESTVVGRDGKTRGAVVHTHTEGANSTLLQ